MNGPTGGGMLALAFGAGVETGIPGALLQTKDPALIQAIFPMSFLLIFHRPSGNCGS